VLSQSFDHSVLTGGDGAVIRARDVGKSVRLRQERRTTPTVSVVIPTCDRPGLLEACLRSVTAVEFDRDAYEVVVVDDGSGEETRTSVRRNANRGVPVRYVRVAGHDANAARNAGVEAARGELIALLDDDVDVPAGWLAALWAGAERWPEAQCFGGPVHPVFEGEPPETCAAHKLAGALFDAGPGERQVTEVWGCNMALRRSALTRAGLFRTGLRHHQEWEWQRRLIESGGWIVYLPDASVCHHRDAARWRTRALLREFFARGYIKATLAPEVSPRAAATRGARWLHHAARTRCTWGWAEVARSAGLLCGAMIGRRRSRRAPRTGRSGARP
jgi:glycosyltransferase involved in cell wall biosynthesis